MGMNIGIDIKGLFKIEALKAVCDERGNQVYDETGLPMGVESTRRILADWFHNRVLTSGRNEIGTNNNWLSTCQVGTDNTAPLTGQTSLLGLVADTSAIHSPAEGAQGTAPYYGWKRVTYRFTAGETAANLNEVGVGWGASGATLFTRALIVDLFGAPTTVTPLADEILDVTYEMRYYPPMVDTIGSIVLNAITYDTITRASSVNNSGYQAGHIGEVMGMNNSDGGGFYAYDGAIGTVLQNPNGTSDQIVGTPLNLTYSNNSFQRDIQAPCQITGWNLGSGIRCISCPTTAGRYQTQFTANPGGGPVPKTASQSMSLTWRLSWAGLDMTGDWTMATAGASTPATGEWNTNAGKTLLRINWTDGDAEDRQLHLQTENGALIKVVETAVPTKWANYRVSSAYTEGTDWTEYTVSEEATAGGGPTVGEVCTLRTVND